MSTFTTGQLNPTNLTTTNVSPGEGLSLSSHTNSNRPGSPSAGTLIYNTEVGGIQVYTGSAWSDLQSSLDTLETWTDGSRPSSNLIQGRMGWNTTNNTLDLYDGTDTSINNGWLSLPSVSPPPPVDLITDADFTTLINYFRARLNNYKNSSFYNYGLDSSPGYISDGGGDMYDGGNYVDVYESGSNQANDINYNTVSTTAGNLRWGALGYTHPLFCISTSGNTSRQYGWYTSGDLGADGGGSTNNSTIYANNSIVNGCIVHSWLCNKAYNAGDPSVNHLYFTLGHPSLNSAITSIDQTDYSTNTNSDYSRYETTSVSCINGRILLSRNSGTRVTESQCETVIQNIATDFKGAFGL